MGRLGGAVLPAFSRRLPPGPAAAGARERAGAGDLSGPLLDPMAGLAGSQVHAAVTGEDAAGQETDAIRMNAQRVLPSTLTGSGGTLAPPASDGAAVPAFALPGSGLGGLGGGGASLCVQVTDERARPALLSLASPLPADICSRWVSWLSSI